MDSATRQDGHWQNDAQPALPDPTASGIEHIILVTMENRSFDHFLGWLPGADGRQQGMQYPDRAGQLCPTHPLAPDYQGCGHPNPDHSYGGGRVAYAGGACDGWLLAGNNDAFATGYYTRADLAFLGEQAPRWTVCDRYFAAIMAETYPNRLYQHAAQTDRLDDAFHFTGLPTIWDRLAERNLDHRYYFSDIPFLALWGIRYLTISRPFAAFLDDCAAGTLPHVAYVDPRFLGESNGTSDDDHPYADIRNGEHFLDRVYSAVTRSPNWSSTVLVITFDEWGGFFDHVPPPTAPIPSADQAAGNTDGRVGFRVPCLLISPWAHRGHVAHAAYDHTSLLRMIEWRWGLAPLTVRDAAANNLATALDFSRVDLVAPPSSVPQGPFGAPCPTANSGALQKWEGIWSLARQHEWPVLD
jgi:phospholipase C